MKKAIKPKDQYSNMLIIALRSFLKAVVLAPGHASSRPNYVYRASIAIRDSLG